jgi:hypothetical protein
VKAKHRPWGHIDVIRIAAQLEVAPNTVKRVLDGGHVRSLPRQRVYRLLVAEDRLHWIAKEPAREE